MRRGCVVGMYVRYIVISNPVEMEKREKTRIMRQKLVLAVHAFVRKSQWEQAAVSVSQSVSQSVIRYFRFESYFLHDDDYVDNIIIIIIINNNNNNNSSFYTDRMNG